MRPRWVIVIVAVSLLATVAAMVYAPGKTSAPEVIRAQRFEVVDADGRVRAQLEFREGQARLQLREEHGGALHPAIELTAGRGPATLQLFGASDASVSLSFHRLGYPQLALWDDAMTDRVSLELGRAGTPALVFADSHAANRLELGLTEEGNAEVILLAEDGRQLRFAVVSDGPVVEVVDGAGRAVYQSASANGPGGADHDTRQEPESP